MFIRAEVPAPVTSMIITHTYDRSSPFDVNSTTTFDNSGSRVGSLKLSFTAGLWRSGGLLRAGGTSVTADDNLKQLLSHDTATFTERVGGQREDRKHTHRSLTEKQTLPYILTLYRMLSLVRQLLVSLE